MKKTKVHDLEKRIKCVESGHHWEITGLYDGHSPCLREADFNLTVKCKRCGLIIDKYLCKDDHKLAASILLGCLSEIGKS